MKETIRRRALELGFDDCRFTSADAPAGANRFQDWVERKHHGEMAWLGRSAPKRIDPQKILPGAKSIICLAASYWMKDESVEVSRPLAPSLSPPSGERVAESEERGHQPSTLGSRPSA